MIRHTAESMQLSLEVWDGSGRNPDRIQLGPGCAACEREQPRVFDRCRKRRTYLARRDAPIGPELAERCPVKLRLARSAGTHGPALFAFGYAADLGDPKQDDRVLALLRDLRHMIDEASSLESEVVRISDELATRYEEINLLYSISGRLARADDLHGTIVQVLEQWRQVVNGSCAFSWLRDRVLLDVSLAPGVNGLTADTRPIWETFARRLLDTIEQTGHDSYVERLPGSHPLARALGGETECIVVPVLKDGRPCGVVCG